MRTVADRFWSKVNVANVDDCWEWSAAVNTSGYGWMYFVKTPRSAHRVSALLNGLIDSIASPLHVLHKCDNRKCCNPKHLFVGTNLDNVLDRVLKGRSNTKRCHGETNPMAKLTDVEVGQIRGLYFSSMFSQSQLAKKYGISQSHISRLVNNLRRGGVS